MDVHNADEKSSQSRNGSSKVAYMGKSKDDEHKPHRIHSQAEVKEVDNQKESEEEIVGEDSSGLMEALVSYCSSLTFRKALDRFGDANNYLFDHVSIDHPNSDSHSQAQIKGELSHEHKGVFDRYQSLINEQFDLFAQANHQPIGGIYRACRDCYEGKYLALFQENEHKWFVDMILSWMEFDGFVAMMCKRAASRRIGAPLDRYTIDQQEKPTPSAALDGSSRREDKHRDDK